MSSSDSWKSDSWKILSLIAQQTSLQEELDELYELYMDSRNSFVKTLLLCQIRTRAEKWSKLGRDISLLRIEF